MRRASKPLPGNLIYAACERFMKKIDPETGTKWTANSIAEWLTNRGYPTTREKIFDIVRLGIDRGFIQLCPPKAYDLAEQLDFKYRFLPKTRILDVRDHFVNEDVADEAATLLVNLIRRVYQDKQDGLLPDDENQDLERVHIGFGAGGTTRMVADRLGRKLKREANLPPLTVHALSSGFATRNPLSAPVAFFSHFYDVHPEVEFIGLFSAAVVKWEEYDDYKDLPGVKEPFEEARKLDITVTSLASAGDDHGMLNTFLRESGKEEDLKESGHVGDVQWRPYSPEGPIEADTGIRAVTIFDIPDLAKFAETEGKHSVLVVGPCHSCQETKEKALQPLFSEPSLRVCNHLVMDITTAEKLLELPMKGG